MKPEKLYSEDGLYGTLDYGGPYPIKAIPHAAFISGGLPKTTRILVIGAGIGYEVVYLIKKGFEFVYSLDVFVPKVKILNGKCIKGLAQKLPFKDKAFDIAFCCETMEHIPEEFIDHILQEVRRVCWEQYFTIASKDDPPFDSHVTVHDGTWWVDRFRKNGLYVANAQINPWLTVTAPQGAILMRYDDGVSIYASS